MKQVQIAGMVLVIMTRPLSLAHPKTGGKKAEIMQAYSCATSRGQFAVRLQK
jgi:hypothetical protein